MQSIISMYFQSGSFCFSFSQSFLNLIIDLLATADDPAPFILYSLKTKKNFVNDESSHTRTSVNVAGNASNFLALLKMCMEVYQIHNLRRARSYRKEAKLYRDQANNKQVEGFYFQALGI